jgi:hypothetical protein
VALGAMRQIHLPPPFVSRLQGSEAMNRLPRSLVSNGIAQDE